ncbi:hypothetical protein [uncultured Bosea sp.]|uniref:hypothetical protein n=1 Tax=uncultured Bosea sp. TaxID=211457 RepID=UPI0025F46174|nr:hypothetical protein [uncultured Bosea sp.]
MSVISFPRQHLGARQPSAFVIDVPRFTVTAVPTALSGVDDETRAAVLAEMARSDELIAEALKCLGRIDELLGPFVAEMPA